MRNSQGGHAVVDLAATDASPRAEGDCAGSGPRRVPTNDAAGVAEIFPVADGIPLGQQAFRCGWSSEQGVQGRSDRKEQGGGSRRRAAAAGLVLGVAAEASWPVYRLPIAPTTGSVGWQELGSAPKSRSAATKLNTERQWEPAICGNCMIITLHENE